MWFTSRTQPSWGRFFRCRMVGFSVFFLRHFVIVIVIVDSFFVSQQIWSVAIYEFLLLLRSSHDITREEARY